MFTAVQAIRVAAAEPRVLGRLEALNDVRRKTAVRYRVYVTLLDTFGVGTSSLALGLVLLLAAGAMRDGRFTDRRLHALRRLRRARRPPRRAGWGGCWPASAPPTSRWMRITTLLDDAPDEALVAAAPAAPRVLRRRRGWSAWKCAA